MNSNLDKQKISELWSQLLSEIGEDTRRTGLQETPLRIAKMYEEMFRGYHTEYKPKITTFPNGEDGITYNQMIIDEGSFYSFCEHHCLPFFGKYWFSYIPHSKGRIVGLSKVAHIIHFHSARLQIQERLVKDVTDDLWKALAQNSNEPKGMALVMKAKHLCKTMRGIKQEGEMTTIELKGLFKEEQKTRQEFFNFVNGGLNG
ncbi:MAG: GTP cyclohydrolase I [Nanoarchaeota archaeon]